MKKAVNYQLQQLRIQQLNRSHASSYYERQENILQQQKKAFCSHKIGWEECEDQNGVPKRHKRIYSCVLYIGFWHDEFIKDIDIDIEELHEEASAFGTVQKISTFPSKPPYKCAFVVFETRAEADRARVGLSKAFNELFIQKITWAQPPNCVADTFKFDTGIGEALRLRTMTSKECNLLGHGFMRMLYGDDFVPSDIIRLCVSFYSSWFDLKIVYCDDETGDIDLSKYEVKAVSMEANLSLGHIVEEIEDGIYKEAVSNEYERLAKLSEDELKEELNKESRNDHIKCRIQTNERRIRCLLMRKFGHSYINSMDWHNPQFHTLRWEQYGRKRSPLVHAWLKFKQIKNIYPVKTETVTLDKELYEDEDPDRWVEVPDDYVNYVTIRQIRALDKNFDTIVIERFNGIDWSDTRRGNWSNGQTLRTDNDGIWPRQRSDDWRQKLQIGDIVDAGHMNGNYDPRPLYFESVIRYVYPKDHETMSGKCVVHLIGLRERENEILDIDSDRIMKRRAYTFGPSGGRLRTDDTRDDRPCSDYGSYYGYGEYMCWRDSAIEYFDTLRWERENGILLAEAGNGFETYRSEKYSRGYIAKKLQPKKKEFRKKWRNHDAKGHDKRIENKMKKYKNSYECLAY